MENLPPPWNLISPHRDKRRFPFPSPQIVQAHSIPPYPYYSDNYYYGAYVPPTSGYNSPGDSAFYVLSKQPPYSPPSVPPHSLPQAYYGNSTHFNINQACYPPPGQCQYSPFPMPEPCTAQPVQGELTAREQRPGSDSLGRRTTSNGPARYMEPQRSVLNPKEVRESNRSGIAPSPAGYTRQRETQANSPLTNQPTPVNKRQSTIVPARPQSHLASQRASPSAAFSRQDAPFSPQISSPASSSMSPRPPAYTSPKPSAINGTAVSSERHRPLEQRNYSQNIASSVQEGRQDTVYSSYRNNQYSREWPDEKKLKPYETLCEGRKKALLIGINYIDTDRRLEGCINDINRMHTFLTNHGGYMEENIVILADDGLEDKKPTRERIIRCMRDLVQGAEPGDSLFFHFSGHGGECPNANGDEDTGMDQFIYPVDYSTSGHILDDDLYDILVKPLPEGCRLTALVDACHSGTMLDLPYTYSKASQNKELFLHINEKGKFKETKSDVVLFSACQDKETGIDATFNNLRAGAMTYLFTAALEQKSNQTYEELFHTIFKGMSSKSESQHPVLSASHMIDTRKHILF